MRTFLLLAATLLGFIGNTGVIHAATLRYTTVLSGANEDPPNVSPGTGSAALAVDTVAQTLLFSVNFANLLGTTTVAHIHGPTAIPGVGNAAVMTQTPTFAGFPVGVTAGSFSGLFDMTSSGTWNPSFVSSQGSVAGAESAFLASLAGGGAYLNIHSSVYGAGEIRGFFSEVTPVPLPAGVLLSLSAIALLSVLRSRGKG